MPLPLSPYPDAEQAVIGYLMPSRPEGYTVDVRGGGGHHIRVRRVGGIDATPAHDNPVLDVIVWGDSDLIRMEIAQAMWAAVRAANNDIVTVDAAPYAVVCFDRTVLGPRQMPDPADSTKTVVMFTVRMLVRAA